MRIPASGSCVWANGRWVAAEQAAVRLTDPGVQSGLGLFETVGVRAGMPLDLGPHLDRLLAGAAQLGIDPSPRVELEQAASEIAAGEAGACGWIKIVCTRGGFCAVFGGVMEPAEVGHGARAVMLPWRRNPADPLVGLKSLNYAPNVLGLEFARHRGADEGLWLNSRGHVAEGCTSNVFVVRRRKLYTADARDGILPGIVREKVLRVARRLGCIVHEGKLRLKRLRQADEAFLTSSLRGVRPLVEIDGRPIARGDPGPLTLRISTEIGGMHGRPADGRVERVRPDPRDV